MRAAVEDWALNVAAHPIGWPLARLARRVGPVVRIPGLGVVISDAALAHEVLVRDDEFRKNGPGSFAEVLTASLGPSALGNMDGEAHQRLRRKLNDVVTPLRAPALLQGIEAPLLALRRRLDRGEPVDLVRFMRHVSGRVTFDMLGAVPPGVDGEAACVALVALGERIASDFDLRGVPASRMESMRRDVDALVAYARAGYDSPAAPATSFVVRLRELGLTFDEARGVLSIIFLAGTLTTAAALPRIVALLLDAGEWGTLRRDRALVPGAIAEGLRYTSPVPATARIASRDAVALGHRFKANTRLIILTCNLARDPKLFPDPDRFDPARRHDPRARHLWFGAGPHFCLGFPVAQLELQMVLDGLLDSGDDLRIVRRTRARGVVVPAYASLVIERIRGVDR